MPTSNSRLAYGDCFDILDRAVDDPKGARIKVLDHASAYSLRTRLHTARRIHRDDNRVTYEKGDPMFGKSPYDVLTVRIKQVDDDYYIYVEKVQLNGKVESLSEVEGDPVLPAPEPPKQLESPAVFKRRV